MKRSPMELVIGVLMLLLGVINALQVYAALPHRPQVQPPLDAAPVFITFFGAVVGGAYLGRYFSIRRRDDARG